MARLRASYTHETRGTVDLEAWQENGRWICVARIGAKRFELATDGGLWGLILQQVNQQALDSPPIEMMPRSKLEKRAVPPPLTPPRRRPIRSIVATTPET
jgi:hypothetical protein